MAKLANEMSVAMLTNRIRKAFTSIGSKNGTAQPESARNSDGPAWEYYISKVLLRLAEARHEAATKSAIDAGVLFDPAKEPRDPGTNEVVYQGDIVMISVNVRSPNQRVDTDGFCNSLRQAGVSNTVIDNALVDNTKTARAPHTFSVHLVPEHK